MNPSQQGVLERIVIEVFVQNKMCQAKAGAWGFYGTKSCPSKASCLWWFQVTWLRQLFQSSCITKSFLVQAATTWLAEHHRRREAQVSWQSLLIMILLLQILLSSGLWSKKLHQWHRSSILAVKFNFFDDIACLGSILLGHRTSTAVFGMYGSQNCWTFKHANPRKPNAPQEILGCNIYKCSLNTIHHWYCRCL